MLFNSSEFLFIFLPITILIFFALIFTNIKKTHILLFISISSLIFYSYWNIIHLPLILFSIYLNYWFAKKIVKYRKQKYLFYVLLLNLLILIYFKYFNFFVSNINIFLNTKIAEANIALPLAISFFTFQQIAFVVDVYRQKIKDFSFLRYLTFVSFFPQLIAGPIVRFQEINPQYLNFKKKIKLILIKRFVVGFSYLLIGIFKKNCIADNLEKIANKIFNNTNFQDLNLIEQWIGVFAYSFQIYFDFSAYSDMAIGLAMMFGFILPQNFNSPYKSTSIIEFWKRWHITLSKFINEYLFFPICASLTKKFYFNESKFALVTSILIPTLITFCLSGLWHGASWNFVLWGALHGVYVCINYFYKYFFNIKLNNIFSGFITFIFVSLAWIPFRSVDFYTTKSIFLSLFGFNSNLNFENKLLENFDFNEIFLFIITLIIIFFLKNNSFHFKKNSNSFLTLNFNVKSACFMFIILISILFFGNKEAEPFIYFQF